MKYLVKVQNKDIYFEDRLTGPVKFDTRKDAEEIADICNLSSEKGYEYIVVEEN